MANRVEDTPYETPSAHRKIDENVPELHDESIEEDSDEEEFPPEDVEVEPSQVSGFSTRGPVDERAVSLSTARQIKASSGQTQNASNNQNIVSQNRKTPIPPRQVDPKRYG